LPLRFPREGDTVVQGNIDVEIEGEAVGENEWAEAYSSEAWSWALFVAGSVARYARSLGDL
jgi:hypothetical protein